ncbi:MAG: DUF167 domain-containing protein [Pyrinomonadaceae bacterium]
MIETNETGGALTFRVRVAPRASQTAAAGVHDGALKVRVAAPPVGGAANAELTRFLAKALGVPARSVEIVNGHASKLKLVRVAGARAADLARLAAGE